MLEDMKLGLDMCTAGTNCCDHRERDLAERKREGREGDAERSRLEGLAG